MGRFVLGVLRALHGRTDVRLTLCCRDSIGPPPKTILEPSPSPVHAGSDAVTPPYASSASDPRRHAPAWGYLPWSRLSGEPGIDVAWFPWNRVDPRPPAWSVVTIHDTAAFDWPVRGRFAFIENHRAQQRLRTACKRATRVMTVSNFSKCCIERHLGVNDARIDVVSEGASLPPAMGTEHPSKPFVLFVGAQDPRKNLDGLLEAWRQLRESNASGEHELVVAGCRRNKIDGVRWLGEIDDVQLAALYQQCALFVMPSRYEGFGLPLLEALASGAPAAAARAASLPEVGGDAVAWFDPENAHEMALVIAKLLADPSQRARLSAAAIHQAALFSWERAAGEVLSSLRRAVASNPRPNSV